ncbi:TPA: hypothetical protein N0F65_010174 [Lagenidium giganteum]|uniref:Uncharacterized protein n=1 Tax=Lagenidium giganteum TaxID=4803 RepID=A0AAV2Z6U4_9STRA|nr:TPA: hypothetical protein N0F65_010174 [Lagenidium giganteum]
MTTASDVFMDTVSLNDDVPRGSNNVDHLEAQFGSAHTLAAISKGKDIESTCNPISETENDDDDDDVVVIVNPRHKAAKSTSPSLPTLPSLRAPTTKIEIHEPVRDYVDPSLFSAEISRHSLDVAHRRAKALEMEVKEMAAVDAETTTASLKLSPSEAVSIIGSAFASSLGRVKKLVNGGAVEYDLLSAGSPSSKMEDLDTDGDGLQLSPDANGNGKHFQTPSVKPALKRISAYSSIESESPSTRKPRRGIQWHAEVLAEHAGFDEEDDCSGESASLMVNGGSSTAHKQSARKKPKGMMRRLTPKEKEELYQQRPDLMIVPNWAQKYREELMEAESTRWSFWLVAIITTLVVLLVVLIILIAREKSAAAQHL